MPILTRENAYFINSFLTLNIITTADAVSAAVTRAWTKYDSAKLERIFETKKRVMSLVTTAQGGSDYDLHRRKTG